MITFSHILEARMGDPGRLSELAARRLLEAIGERSFTMLESTPAARQELGRRGHHRAFGLRAAFAAASLACVTGQALREAGRLGKKLGCPVIFSGRETGGEVCVLPLGGGLVRCGGRDAEGVTRGGEVLLGVAEAHFDCPPWAWTEAVMEDLWRTPPGK